MPDGKSIVLERQPDPDTGGYAGLEDETMLSVGAEAGTSQNENNLVQAIRSGASNSISQTGQQIIDRQLNIRPTLTICPGFPVRVVVTRDLVGKKVRNDKLSLDHLLRSLPAKEI
ncbi:type IV secretory pathway VirB10-like protein [Bradyrhizobium sp. USDA 313]